MAHDKQAFRERQRDVQTFRDHARDVAIAHLAPMLEAFVAIPHSPLRFDVERVRRLETQLGLIMETFVAETRVDDRSPEELFLERGLEDEKYRTRAENACERLAKLWPPMRPKGH